MIRKRVSYYKLLEAKLSRLNRESFEHQKLHGIDDPEVARRIGRIHTLIYKGRITK